MISDDRIEVAKQNAKYGPDGPLHEHNDCIRMAYEWLDAQKKLKHPIAATLENTKPIKHLIEKWCGRYVSESDVTVAALLHVKISGEYPHFNISKRFTEPSIDRLKEIPEAFTHEYRDRFDPSFYAVHE